jgi:protein-tyrosine-phosphatase
MAEGFARRYGSDVLEPASAGLAPALIVQPLTKKVMSERNINIDDQHPKDLGMLDLKGFDLIVNMSGTKLPPRMPIEVREWKVEDPIGQPEEVYVTVRDQIENAVMRLILEFRRQAQNGNKRPLPRRAKHQALPIAAGTESKKENGVAGE